MPNPPTLVEQLDKATGNVARLTNAQGTMNERRRIEDLDAANTQLMIVISRVENALVKRTPQPIILTEGERLEFSGSTNPEVIEWLRECDLLASYEEDRRFFNDYQQ